MLDYDCQNVTEQTFIKCPVANCRVDYILRCGETSNRRSAAEARPEAVGNRHAVPAVRLSRLDNQFQSGVK